MTNRNEVAQGNQGKADGAEALAPQRGGPSASYDQTKAVNWSSLKNMAVSPLLYRWRLEHPQPRTAAFVIGGAIHCAALEPGKFDARYALFDGTRRGKAWDEWNAERPGAESLKPAEMERVMRSAEALRSHRVASRLLAQCRAEEPTVWKDFDTGMACKGRLDSISATYVLDLKSTKDPAPRQFERSSAGYLYHGQLAWYRDGAITAKKLPPSAAAYIVAVQSSEPYDVAVYALTDETLAHGRSLYRSLLRRLARCIEADWWPGVAPDLEILNLPPWVAGETSTVEEESF